MHRAIAKAIAIAKVVGRVVATNLVERAHDAMRHEFHIRKNKQLKHNQSIRLQTCISPKQNTMLKKKTPVMFVQPSLLGLKLILNDGFNSLPSNLTLTFL